MPSTPSQRKNDQRPQAVWSPASISRIETEEEYELAIERIEELWESADGTPEAEARDVLVRWVEEYETRHEDFE
jgi:antitoxin component HigA of HigAB toxin-antitoxin module